jgi:hypothetical protein
MVTVPSRPSGAATSFSRSLRSAALKCRCS